MHPGVPERWVRSHEDALQLISEHTVAPAVDFAVGAELEWPVIRRGFPAERVTAADVSDALGRYAPGLNGRSAALPCGSVVTLEPGGQLELSSSPANSPQALIAALTTDSSIIRRLLARASLELVSAAADTSRAPQRVLDAPRYRAMERAFGRNGPAGLLMMTNTAAVQVCVSAGASVAEATQRWMMLNEVGPALLAAFASSPKIAGGAPGGWASQRMRSWFTLDPPRTRLPQLCDPVQGYAEWALQVPLLCVRRDGESWDAPPGLTLADWISGSAVSAAPPPGLPYRYPTREDVLYHLSTLFPPVRPRGYFEVRYLDQQPDDGWPVAVAVISALCRTPEVVARSRDIVAGTSGLWMDAARLGMRDPRVSVAATNLLAHAAANAATPELGALIDNYLWTKRSRNTHQRRGCGYASEETYDERKTAL